MGIVIGVKSMLNLTHSIHDSYFSVSTYTLHAIVLSVSVSVSVSGLVVLIVLTQR